MKKQISPRLASLIFSILVICFAIGFYAFAAWQEPTQPQPGGNVDAPINAGEGEQYKRGALGIGGLFVTYDDTYLVVESGNVGIGTTSPSKKLDVSGEIHATGDICTDQGGGGDGVCLSASGGGGGRITYYARKATRGTTTTIPEAVIIEYCGDNDGCQVRMGMYDWDGTGRTASRGMLFYYNRNNKNWRSNWADWAGTNNNGVVEHVIFQWACYFTDGEYKAWASRGDPNLDFGLLSWNQYNAECRLTIID